MISPDLILVGEGYVRLVSEPWVLTIFWEAEYQSAQNRIVAAEAVSEYRKRKQERRAA